VQAHPVCRILGMSVDKTYVWRQTLRPCQAARAARRFAHVRTYPDVLATPRSNSADRGLCGVSETAGSPACPLCLEEMTPPPVDSQGGAASAGADVRNLLELHAECFTRWKGSRAGQERRVSGPAVEDEPEPGEVHEREGGYANRGMNQSSHMSPCDYLLGMIVHTDPIEPTKSMFSAVRSCQGN
jgi:hypothetical protein